MTSLSTKGQALTFNFAERFSKSFAGARESQRNAWLADAEELGRVVVHSSDSTTGREEVLELQADCYEA